MGVPGGKRDLDRLFSLAYEELRRLAAGVKRKQPKLSLSPTALVNEAWLRLTKAGMVSAESPEHFRGVAAQAMRHVLIDMARERGAEKRGGQVKFVTLNDSVDQPVVYTAGELLRLDAILAELAAIDPFKAQIVECKYFARMQVGETAEALGVSKTKVERDWRFTKNWLKQRLEKND